MSSVQLSYRPRHTRTRAGCFTCRARKKKCDETRPRCEGCRRNLLDCQWPPSRAPKGSDSAAPTNDQPGSRLVVRRVSPAAALSDSPPPVNVPPSIPSVPVGAERACALTPQSVTLLSHYIRETAGNFAMTPLKDNPFITLLLPLGYMDDLLMHGLLAFGGAHLTHKESSNVELATATRLHYSRLIGGLRAEFASLREDDLEKTERLLRVLMVACHYEAISGDTQGNMFNHLRASRNLLQLLLTRKPSNQHSSAVNRETLGFSVEIYTYLMLTNTITPYGIANKHNHHSDPFVMPLEDMGKFPTFGALFGGSHELFCLVPEVSQLATRRLAEETTASSLFTAALKRRHNDIHSRITSWEMPPPRPGEAIEDWEYRRDAAETLRQGLYIYLATAHAGSIVSDPVVLGVINGHMRQLFSYGPRLMASQFAASIFWPVIIGASCMVHPKEHEPLLQAMRGSRWSMKHLVVISNILQLLWDDPDPRAFGPYGLYLTMEKHGLSIGIA